MVLEVVEAKELHADDVIVVATSGHAQPDRTVRVLDVLSTEHPLLRIRLPDGRTLVHAVPGRVCRVREPGPS